MRPLPYRSLFAVATLIVILLSLGAFACNSDGDVSEPTETAVPATTTPGATAAEPTTPPFQGSREPAELISDVIPTPILMDVRAAAHEDFDRVVFEFADSRPGYRVEYVDEAIACGSGIPVEVAGGALLRVRMQPATAHDEAGMPTFPSQEVTPGLWSILAVVQTCDFEGEVTWVVGLTEEVDFVLSTYPDPFRIVIDVAHPS